MKFIDLERHLEKESPRPLYLFKGEAVSLMEEAWEKLVEKLVPSGARRFNTERLSAREHGPERVLERVRTLPMFGTRRVILVQSVEAWGKHQKKAFLKDLEKPVPTTCLVLTTSQKKSEFEALVSKQGMVVELGALSEREAPKWAQGRARRLGKQLSSRAASLLVEQTGADFALLERELDKLCLYVGDREKIDLEDVKEAGGIQRRYSAFDMVDYVGAQRSGRAMVALQSLMLSGESPLAILALLARHIRLLWQVKDGMDQGLSSAHVAKALGLPPFVVGKYARQVSLFSQKELFRFHRAFRAADLAMKSTGTPPAAILENLIVGLCQRKEEEG